MNHLNNEHFTVINAINSVEHAKLSQPYVSTRKADLVWLGDTIEQDDNVSVEQMFLIAPFLRSLKESALRESEGSTIKFMVVDADNVIIAFKHYRWLVLAALEVVALQLAQGMDVGDEHTVLEEMNNKIQTIHF